MSVTQSDEVAQTIIRDANVITDRTSLGHLESKMKVSAIVSVETENSRTQFRDE